MTENDVQACIDKQLGELPKQIKSELNGSVAQTVQQEMGKYLKWFGLGGIIMVCSVGVAWGALDNQVKNNTKNIDSLIERTLSKSEVQAAVIEALNEDSSEPIKVNLP